MTLREITFSVTEPTESVLRMRLEQRFDAAAQRFITRTGFIQVGGVFGVRNLLECGQE